MDDMSCSAYSMDKQWPFEDESKLVFSSEASLLFPEGYNPWQDLFKWTHGSVCMPKQHQWSAGPVLNSEGYEDLRAQEEADNRIRKQKQKYYGYRGVKPSWAGQKYYGVTLVTEETVSWKKSRKTRSKTLYPAAVIERELDHPKQFSQLFLSDRWSAMFLSPYIDLAIAEARHSSTNRHPEHQHETFTPSYSTVDTIEAPETFHGIREDMKSCFGLRPSTFPSDARVKLKIRTWTKKDNFEWKGCFTGGPDRRHSRGKRKVREKRLQKWNMRTLQRNAKSHLVTAEDVEEGIGNKRDEEADADSLAWAIEYDFVRIPPLYPIIYAYVDPDCRYEHHTVHDPYWYDSDDDEADNFDKLHNGSDELLPEEWNKLRSNLAPTYYPERYNWQPAEDKDNYDSWPVEPVQAYSVRFVSSIRRSRPRLAGRKPAAPVYTPATSASPSEYEPSLADTDTDEDEDRDGEEFWDAFASSLNSSDVIIVSPQWGFADQGNGSGMSEFDNMSDLAEAIVDVEWDVLSESSMALA